LLTVRKSSSNWGPGATAIIICMLLFCLSSVFISEAHSTSREEALGRLASHWIEISEEQYGRGMYEEAQRSMERASEHEEYLSSEQRSLLDELAEKVRLAIEADEENAEAAEEAQRLKEQQAAEREAAEKEDQELRRREEEERTEQEARQREEAKRQEQELAEQQAREREELDERIREIEIAEDELLDAVEDNDEPETEVADRPVVEQPQVEREVEDVQESGYIDEIRRRQNVIRSHTRAVVNDAVERAEGYASENNFSDAHAALVRAERLVERNQMDLGRDFYNENRNRLAQLKEQIEKRKQAHEQQRSQLQKEEAQRAQQEYVDRMSQERKQRIDEMLSNARAYMQQQRFEEALEQVRSVVAIDPLHEDALWLKQRLEDTIMFRDTREVHRRADDQRARLLKEADESAIPWAEEVTYPEDWREIMARREPERAIGYRPETAEVYERLEQRVDLSELSPNMPLREAIDIIRNSVSPSLHIIVMWRNLFEEADIDQYTPINMDGLDDVRLITGLELLLRSISPGFAPIGYIVQDGVITIDTVEALPSEMETMVYDVTDLLGMPAQFESSMQAAQTGGTDAHQMQAGFQDQQQQQHMTLEQRQQMVGDRAAGIVELIEETIDPPSWEFRGGEGSIQVYEGRKLIVRQTVPVHRRIEELLDSMRTSLGEQISIEARFLVVGENFLEDIGLDLDMVYSPGGRWDPIQIQQQSFGASRPEITGVPGSLADTAPALTGAGGYGSILDDLQVSFLLRASQVHRDSKSLTAPRVTVLSGESATIRVQQDFGYAYDIDVTTREIGELGRSTFDINYQTGMVSQGSILNITPTLMPDKRHVLLNITAEQRDFLGFREQSVAIPVFGDAPLAGDDLSIEFPETEISRVQTRVSVPDGGTLLLGGQKITAEIEREAGVPVLSKLPVVGRLFSNRGYIKDYRVLLILVKPTIILQEEKEAEAIGAMEW